MKKYLGLIVMVSLVVVLAGCGLFDTKTAQLAIKLTDAPANNIESVVVTIKSVAIQGEDGEVMLQDFGTEPQAFDLLTLRFDEKLLGQESIPVGNYSKIVLTVDDTTGSNYVIDADGVEHELKVPSKTFKINHAFNIQAGGILELVLDADVRDFISLRGNEDNNNGFIINPTAIRVYQKQVTANVSGQVLKEDNTAIVDVNVNVEVYNLNNELVAGTIALAEDFTDENGTVPAGSFKLKGLAAGEYYLVVKAEGYQEYKSETITVVAEENQKLEVITLTPAQV